MSDTIRIDGLRSRTPEPVEVMAGPMRMLFDGSEIRYIRLGRQEVLRRVYVAVRDHNWHTIAGEVHNLKVHTGEGEFQVSFEMVHQGDGIGFSWAGSVVGERSGRSRFEMNGRALTSFRTNRTGFCVLYPLEGCVGRPCRVERPDGSVEEGEFPKQISPHQPFKDIRAIEHKVGNATVRVLMEGEVFEMEDQRNWSDGSFKTYCRPLGLPYPYELRAGEQVRQTITIELSGEVPETADREPSLELDLRPAASHEWVPQIGVCAAEGLEGLDEQSLKALKSLRPRHLRYDIRLEAKDWAKRLRDSAGKLRELGFPIEAAVYMPDLAYDGPLADLAVLWKQLGLTLARWIILPNRGVTKREHIEAARKALGTIDERALFVAGTDAEFVAINRFRPPVELVDAVSFSLNPQVHAFDNLSLVENLESQTDMVRSAIEIAGERPICVSPITLKRRSNPDATGPDSPEHKGELPGSVDLRQISLFAAAWTVGSLTHLCHADFLTYFETHSWRGLMQGPEAPPLPELFPSRPGELFPVYHALKAVLSFPPEHWTSVKTDSLRLAGLLLDKPGRQRLLLANLTRHEQQVALELPNEATITLLDASTVEQAGRDAEFWVNGPGSSLGSSARVTLSAYAIAQIDWSII